MSRPRPRRRGGGWRAGLVLLLLWAASAFAIDELRLQWALLEGEGWSLHDASLVLDFSAGPSPVLVLRSERLEAGAESLRDLRLRCAAFELTASRIRCRDGRLDAEGRYVRASAAPARLEYDRRSGGLSIAVSGLLLAGGSLDLAFARPAGAWRLDADLHGLELQALSGLARALGVTWPEWSAQGRLAGRLTLAGGASGVSAADWSVEVSDGGYSNAAGDQAAESLAASSNGRARRAAGAWSVKAGVRLDQGLLYSDPLYLEFSRQRPLILSTEMRLDGGGRARLDRFSLRQAGVVELLASGRLRPASDRPLEILDVELRQARLPALYEIWLQPWLAGTVLDALETQGRVRGRLHLTDAGVESVRLQLEDVSFREADGQFAAEGLDGDLRWDASGETRASTLSWQALSFYRLRLEEAALRLESNREHVRLAEPLRVPVLDGALLIDEFEAGRDAGGVRWLLDGQLTPVSMRDFSTALGWTPLSGKLSGMIPKMRYEQGVLSLGGILLVQAFDGDITLRNLRLEQPLGLVPRLWLDARMENVDLRTLTKTFSFGRIEGRVRGEVNGLYMEAWQPVAFDAFIGTPEDDDSRHRISQRAVDNISNLGGTGVSGALSRSFLRLFEDFPYRRLGIRCRLENGVCHMGGIAPAAQGYYLVQGTLLPPRLDVIGYVDEVDWQSLVDRLVAVTSGNPPVIE